MAKSDEFTVMARRTEGKPMLPANVVEVIICMVSNLTIELERPKPDHGA